jgi:predicted DNA-binding transcriptional regulator YafY
LYLLAHVPEYNEVRTFAVERIDEISLLEDRFTPVDDMPDEAFPHSLGVHSGPPESVTIEFEREVAGYVRAREWHGSQVWTDANDGRLVLTLQVCIDRALRSWILSFGPFARVAAPESLARDIASQIEQARARYAPQPE